MSGQKVSAAVCIAVYNESENALHLFEAITRQTRAPDELIIVDDGSTDNTAELLEKACSAYSGTARMRLIRQRNAGPAVARNTAWQAATSEVCVFTDGDCLPESTWIEKLLRPLENDARLLGAAGVYSAPTTRNQIARFIGYEILWRYRAMPEDVDCHGTYNLAIRRETLVRLGGFNENYPKPSGEDFDLTYRVSALGPIRLARDSAVAHEHPTELWAYLKNQYRRGFDRVRLYLDHPSKMAKDSYTDPWVKFEVLGAAAFVASLPLYWVWEPARVLSLVLATSLAVGAARPFGYLLLRAGLPTAIFGIGVRFVRTFAWMLGMLRGVWDRWPRTLAKRVWQH